MSALPHPERLRATLIGFIAVLLWATLALFTTATGQVPPFQLLSLTFGIAFAVCLVRWLWLARRDPARFRRIFRQPWPVWLLGIVGLFGYHALYFTALDHAPPVEASLIAYLWPLLIVLLSALLPGERLHWTHLLGGGIGLLGAILLVLQKADGAVAFDAQYVIGYLAALGCAFTWSIYSVMSRRFGRAPTDLVGAFCGATALLGVIAHGVLGEPTIWPADAWEWAAIVALGLGPVGLAFFVWDYGVKRGDIKALGACSYASPLLSTILLILAGKAEATMTVILACLLIIGGAVIASRDLWMRRATPSRGAASF
ncbi:aromatic amino acid exporter YddG [Dongia deserti]|uniref:aromatic amino acid exporter YddG n=1 Tax=Dongia deserti TaxID=2268030 RepID=UPI000E64E4B9|nr:DMT family transporter [Dongia deserti]